MVFSIRLFVTSNIVSAMLMGCSQTSGPSLPAKKAAAKNELRTSRAKQKQSIDFIAPALSSWDKFVEITRQVYAERVKGKFGDRKDNEVVEVAPEFRGKTVSWQGKYRGLKQGKKDKQITQVKLDLLRPLTPPIVTTFRCQAPDAKKWSGVPKGSRVRFSGKIVLVGAAWVKLKMPFGGEKRVQMMAVEVKDVIPSLDKKYK